MVVEIPATVVAYEGKTGKGTGELPGVAETLLS